MKVLKRLLGLGGVGGVGGGPQPVLRVLMVCSGNICRSPTAEGVLRAKLECAGLADRIEVDSAGTQGLHAREAPDPRAQAHARQRGYDLSKQRARQVVAEDFARFQRIFAMDDGHLQWLRAKAPPGSRAQLDLLMAHAVKHRDRDIVPDPYFGSDRDFALALDLMEDACDGLVAALGRELVEAGLAGDIGR